MFSSMAEHFVDQIKISRDFYTTQYSRISSSSTKNLKRNAFGFFVDLYLRKKTSGDMALFETESGRAISKFLEEVVTIEEESNEEGHYYVLSIDKERVDPQKNETDIKKAAREYEKARQMIEIHNNNAIISLLIRFENFLYSYFKFLISKYPDKYFKDKSIKYSDLIKYNFEEIKHEVASEVASDIMRQSLDDWLKRFNEHKLDLEPLSISFETFREVYYRRNLIVHNNGIINRQYIEAVGKSDISNTLGKKLSTDKEYILSAYSIAMIIVYGLLYASLKINPDDKEEYLEFLFTSGFDHMINEDWEISSFIFGLLINKSNRDCLDSKYITYAQINYWLSQKSMGYIDNIRKDIEQSDYAAMEPATQMAKELLLERYESAVSFLDQAISIGLSPEVVASWPIFMQFRKTKHYKAFQEKYASQLEHQSISPNELVDVDKSTETEINALKQSFVAEKELDKE